MERRKPPLWANVKEEVHQENLCTWWKLACRKYGLPEMALAHPPNEAMGRSVIAGYRLKKTGMRKGFPDLQLCAMRGGHGSLFIELKSYYGKASPEQLAWLEFLRSQGYAACLCVGADAARQCIEDYLAGKAIPERM